LCIIIIIIIIIYEQYCDVMAESLNNGARAGRPLLSNDPEITFPLQRIAANELLPSDKLMQDSHDTQQDNRG
jgi:hypothetical protein